MKTLIKALSLITLMAALAFANETIKMPKFELPDLEGKIHTSAEYKGKPVLLDFWATWCITCAQTIPQVKDWQSKYSEKGLQILGISIDKRKGRKMNKFIKKYQMNYPLLWDKENSLATPLNFESIPTMFLFDSEGKLILALRGVDEEGEKQMEKALEELFK